MTRDELTAKRAEYRANIDRLERQLADPFTSRSVSAGGGAKSASSSPAEIRKSIAYFRREIALIDAALGAASMPGVPVDVNVRFDA